MTVKEKALVVKVRDAILAHTYSMMRRKCSCGWDPAQREFFEPQWRQHLRDVVDKEFLR